MKCIALFGLLISLGASAQIDGEVLEKNRLLPPSKGNARNSEGDFVQLKDGRLLFVYTKFKGAGDHAHGQLASRYSNDGGRSWDEEDTMLFERGGKMNDMSVSLLRLRDGRIALFYLQKNSLKDCRPVMRVSTDESKTWSDPVHCITDEVGYYVLNNDRVIQLDCGRLIFPVAFHHKEGLKKPDWNGVVMCYSSDDFGKTWKRNKSVLGPRGEGGQRWVSQEPGLVELADKRIMMFIRSNAGSQLVTYSKDKGETWGEVKKSQLISPVSPAAIERIPGSANLLAIWNNHRGVAKALKGKRTPLHCAVSKDGGLTWGGVKVLEDDPGGWYCYTAIEFVADYVVLGYCAGMRSTGGLNVTQVTRFPLKWILTDE